MPTLLKGGALALMRRVGVTAAVADSAWRRRRLLILCYHGVARWNEHEWNPRLYVSARRFRHRMEMLRRLRCAVLPLGEAVERLARGDLPERAVVLTFDDGFVDFATTIHPILKLYRYPATVYLTTLRCEHNFPVVRLLASYLLWFRRDRSLDASGLPGFGDDVLTLASEDARSAIVARLMNAGEDRDKFGHDQLVRGLADRLDVNYDAIVASRLLTLLSPREVTALSQEGVDFQLHTHRHRSPSDPEQLVRELRDNGERIEAMTGRRPTHFCWPSGVYYRALLPVLASERIATATTCDPGLATARDHPLLLPRFVDTSAVSEMVFQSWLGGTAAWMPRRTAAQMLGAAS